MFAQDIVESLSLLMSKEEDDRVLCMALQTMAVLLEAGKPESECTIDLIHILILYDLYHSNKSL